MFQVMLAHRILDGLLVLTTAPAHSSTTEPPCSPSLEMVLRTPPQCVPVNSGEFIFIKILDVCPVVRNVHYQAQLVPCAVELGRLLIP